MRERRELPSGSSSEEESKREFREERKNIGRVKEEEDGSVSELRNRGRKNRRRDAGWRGKTNASSECYDSFDTDHGLEEAYPKSQHIL